MYNVAQWTREKYIGQVKRVGDTDFVVEAFREGIKFTSCEWKETFKMKQPIIPTMRIIR